LPISPRVCVAQIAVAVTHTNANNIVDWARNRAYSMYAYASNSIIKHFLVLEHVKQRNMADMRS
jgi:hypothetical protein